MIPDKWCTHQETGELIVWESCQTLAGSWGYNRDENWTWKSPQTLIELLINCVSLGGNLIMNIGPTSRGCFDERADDALDVYAKWMKYHARSIYGCTMAEPGFTAPVGCRLTQSNDDKRLYLHLFEYSGKDILIPNLAGKVEYAQMLHDGSEIIFTESENGYVKFRLPQYRPNVVIPVIEFFLKD
jgi:alpha-L-fucosidase